MDGGRDEDEPGMPPWVKASLAVAALLVVGFVALHLTGNGFQGGHGP